jgi:hypothetical protein
MLVSGAQYIPSTPTIPPEEIHDCTYDCDDDDFFEHRDSFEAAINVGVFYHSAKPPRPKDY